MAKYLKEFENHNAYTAYTADTANFVTPNVSYCVEENEVHMTPLAPTPPTPTYDYVEIGGLKWATMNVGATAVTDGGLYFAWGDTQGYTADQVFNEFSYKWYGYDDITKYNDEDGKTVLDLEDDAARVNMGGNWRMPTSAEYQSLIDATTRTWTNDYQGSGVSGFVFTSKADSNVKLFFPAVGYVDGGIGSMDEACAWSNSLDPNYITQGSELRCWGDSSENIAQVAGMERYCGLTIRGVMDT